MTTYTQGNFTARIRLLRHVKILFSEVVFGTPGKRCEGSGLCRIYTVTGAKRLEPHARRIPVILYLTPGGQFGIRLNEKDLSTVLHREVFNRDVFTLEEDFVIPKYFARKLATAQFTLPSGDYPTIKRGDWIQVVF